MKAAFLTVSVAVRVTFSLLSALSSSASGVFKVKTECSFGVAAVFLRGENSGRGFVGIIVFTMMRHRSTRQGKIPSIPRIHSKNRN